MSSIPLEHRPPVQDLTGDLPIPDHLDTIIACNTGGPSGSKALAPAPPRPKSAWLETEQRLYADALGKITADILVVPFQIQGRGFDRVERALMTANLAYAIGDAGGGTVADPFLTSLALGEGARRIDMQAAERLAQKIGARKIVVAYVGHDAHHAFTLTLQVIDVNRGTGATAAKTWQHDWRAIPFTDEKTPAIVFHEMLPEVLTTLPLQLFAKRRAYVTAGPISTQVTGSPLDLVTAGKPSSSAATFALLGALAPPYEENARQRLFERALLAAMRTRKPKAADTFLEVYALMCLERRPRALARLPNTESPEFDALRALSNGDLPAARLAISKVVADPFQQLLLQLELRDLELTYGKKDLTEITAAAKVFGKSAPSWIPLVALRSGDYDVRSAGSPLTIKQALDESFPSEALDTESVMRGSNLASGESADDVNIDIANGHHVRRALAGTPTQACCRSQGLRAGRWDLLWLLQGLSEHRMEKALHGAVTAQGQATSAIEALSRYDAFFGGHPALTAAGAHAALTLARRRPDDEQQTWLERGRRDALAAVWWTQGQSHVGERATRALGIPSPDSVYWLEAYGQDYPRHARWAPSFIRGDQANDERQAGVLEALTFSRNDLTALMWFNPGADGQDRKAFVASLGTRFAGHPALAAMASTLAASDDTSPKTHLEAMRCPPERAVGPCR